MLLGENQRAGRLGGGGGVLWNKITLPLPRLRLSYANLSWGSTNRANFKKLLSQQKHAIRIINKLFKSHKILNIYKLNDLGVTVFTYQIRNKTVNLIFLGGFEIISQGYLAKFS